MTEVDEKETIEGESTRQARVAVIGAGWWCQGWHLPHLHRNPCSTIAAICDTSPHPKSALNPNLESLNDLSKRYDCALYLSIDDLLADATHLELDGIIVCTPHATHYELGRKIIEECQVKLHILMEKPFTTCVKEALLLHDLAKNHVSNDNKAFLINHSANYREQAMVARRLVTSGNIGDIKHVTAFMGSPLIWIFDDTKNKAWNEPSGTMIGNGFAWGQSSHILAWIFHVTGLDPSKVFCAMNHSDKTGADVSHSATIICECGSNMSLSGTTLIPGNAHSDPPVGKLIRIKIFGSKGAIVYSGDDRDLNSGRLEFRKLDGSIEEMLPGKGFLFENTDDQGYGPESLQSFLNACIGKNFVEAANSACGLKTVKTIDAMYRSSISFNVESVHH